MKHNSSKEETYCVHIYPRPYEYENIRAENPDKAKEQAIAEGRFFWDDIDHIEVMRQCECGYDNEVDEMNCAECGVRLRG